MDTRYLHGECVTPILMWSSGRSAVRKRARFGSVRSEVQVLSPRQTKPRKRPYMPAITCIWGLFSCTVASRLTEGCHQVARSARGDMHWPESLLPAAGMGVSAGSCDQ